MGVNGTNDAVKELGRKYTASYQNHEAAVIFRMLNVANVMLELYCFEGIILLLLGNIMLEREEKQMLC